MKLKMTDRYVEMHTYLSGYKYDGKDMVNWKPIIPFFSRLLDWEKVWSKFRSLSQKRECEKAHSRRRHDCIMYQGLWWCGAGRWMIRALTPAVIPLPIYSHPHNPLSLPCKSRSRFPQVHFSWRRWDGRTGGGDCRVSCHQEAQFFLWALRLTARVAVSMLQVCHHGSAVSTAYMMGGPC